MNAITSPAPAAVAPRPVVVAWFPVFAFALVWIELVVRLRYEWSINPQYAYGWIVPFLTAYIFWQRYQNAPPPSDASNRVVPILLLVAAAIFLVPVRLIQEANPDWRLLSWAMTIAVAITTLCGVYLSGGKEWARHFLFPILFFFVAVPWPTQLEQFVIQGLMRLDAFINVEALNAMGIPAVQLGNIIEVGSGFVGIDEACTGIRSLQATFMVSLFLGEFYGLTAGRRTILIIAGACLAFCCNLLRTFLLVWLGVERGSATIKNWHDPAGHTILMVCLLLLWGLCALLRNQDKSVLAIEPSRAPSRIPRFVICVLLGLTITAEAGTQIWYRAHETKTSQTEPWTVQWPSDALNWKSVPIADNAQDLLRYNEGGGGAWTSEDGHDWNMYFFRWLPGRTAGLFVKNHRPDICLPASGMKQRGIVQRKVVTVNNVMLPIRSYVFENEGRSLHVFYCYWDGMPPDPSASDNENWTALGRLQAAAKGKRDVGTQMLEIVGWDYNDAEKAEQATIEQLGKIIRQR